jgi:hypothetical protein
MTDLSLPLLNEADRRSTAPATLLVAIGGGVTLFGLMITAFSAGGTVPGLVVLTIGLALLVPGVVRARAVNRRLRYRLTHPFSTGLFLAMVAVTVVLVGGGLALAVVLDVKAAIFLSAIPPLVIPMYMRLRTALVMTRIGLAVGGPPRPWSAVAQLEVVPVNTTDVEIAAVPRDPSADRHRAVLPARKFDSARLTDAVSRFAPPGIRVVVHG